ncbi:MAG TPA: M6 family metalloprotease domain-containing protein [Longimicrobium sp.]|nr:M6 family metalloprotease domain-containing protein [Longimicrobium sp.]
MFSLLRRPLAAAAALVLAAPSALVAQGDPPDWVRRFLDAEQRQPFANAWLKRARAAQAAVVEPGAPAPPPGQRALTGTFGMVVIAATFSDVPPPFPTSTYQQAWFGETGINGGYSLSQYYREVSRGRFTFTGTVTPWITLARTAASYQANTPYPGRGLFMEYIRDALLAADAGVDWTQYDNDGADGIPNSGDDDGVVDMVALMHPLPDGACNNAISGFTGTGFRLSAMAGGEFVTHSVGKNGSPIRVNDFVLSGAVNCAGTSPAGMNIPVHEMGHALGLPDLNDLDRSSYGVGRWDVMGYGLYLADGRPAHLGAWSLRQLGWAQVTRVTESGDVRLDPAANTGQVVEVGVPGSREHFLLENRQRVGSDTPLPGSGLLVWRVHPDVLDGAVLQYRGTEDEANPGLMLVQADGRNDLASRQNFGDASDPFPGSGNVVLVNGQTTPSTRDHATRATGISLQNIAEQGGVVTLRVDFAPGVPEVPPVTVQQAAAALVGGTPLTTAQQQALDQGGNRNGRFDVGDALILWLLNGSPAFPGVLP